MAQNTAATATKGGGKAAPPTESGRAASAAGSAMSVTGPAAEVTGSAALAVRPTDPRFLQALRTLIFSPQLAQNYYGDQEWNYRASVPVILGKYLAMVLRHRAVRMGVYLDEEGYVSVSDLLREQTFLNNCPDAGTFHWVVLTNPKGRFEFRVDESSREIKIRALQGHSGRNAASIDPDLAMTRVDENNLPN